MRDGTRRPSYMPTHPPNNRCAVHQSICKNDSFSPFLNVNVPSYVVFVIFFISILLASTPFCLMATMLITMFASLSVRF